MSLDKQEKTLDRTLVVVPTAGNHNIRLQDGSLTPSRRGELRVKKAAELLCENPDWALAIIGGNRKDRNETEARVYCNYVHKVYVGLVNRIIFTLDNHRCTVLDMVELAYAIRRENYWTDYFDDGEIKITKIILVTHPYHAEISDIPLQILLPDVDILCVPSDEKQPYSPRMQRVRLWITRHDPFWHGLLTRSFTILALLRKNPPHKLIQ